MSQTGQNISVRLKAQSGLGVRATGTGGIELPIVPSAGLRLAKAAIPSPEVRSDGMNVVGRHGSRSVGGEYGVVVREGSVDELLRSVCGSTWSTVVNITQATMTSITTTTNTIVAAAGSWITQGVRVGDIVTLTLHSTAANNNLRLPVLGVTASTITVPAGSLVADAVADTTFNLAVARRLVQGTAKTYWTVEEYHADIDQSEIFEDVVWSNARFAMQPDASLIATFGGVGRNAFGETTGNSPILTSPTAFQTQNLTAVDALILRKGVVETRLSGFDVTIERNAQTVPVIGSVTSPDVYPDNARVTGTISGLRVDLTMLQDFIDETEFELLFLFRETGAAPQRFFSLFLPVVKLMEAPSAELGNSGPMISTMAFEAGRKPTTSGYVETMVQFATSTP